LATPAIAEFLPGYEASAWHGIAASRKMPANIIETLNKEINVRLADSKSQAQIAATGYEAFATSPADFGRLVVEETEKWAKVIKFAGIKPE
jgi:tripartite-type tricarboxylate transporter receptor subunit TctC